MLSSEIWTLIGVIIGAILGFGLSLSKDWLRGKQQKTKYLKILLSDLEYNKNLLEKNPPSGYRTLGYILDAEVVKYLLDLSKGLLSKIYDIQTKTSLLPIPPTAGAESPLFKALSNLLDEVIPELKKYLKVK